MMPNVQTGLYRIYLKTMTSGTTIICKREEGFEVDVNQAFNYFKNESQIKN